jgi:peptidyl-prolyl cis-trans isomerase D
MLDSLRRGAKTWVAKLLLGLLVLSFGAWGIADVFRNTGVPVVAEVGNTEIEAATFQRQYQRQVQAFSRQIGQPVTPEMATAFGVPQRVLSQLMADAALTGTAKDYGLGVSNTALAKEIADDPALRPQGAPAFDRVYFTQLLAQNGLTEAAYVADRRVDSLRRQLFEGLVGGTAAPKALVEAAYRYTNETRQVDYVTLTAAAVQPIPAPTETELSTWFEDHKAEFQAPELRTVDILAVTPEAIADPSAITDDDARKEYDRTKAQYVVPEQRQVAQILFPTTEEAAAADAKIKSGTSFEQILAERSLKPEDVDLGLITKDKIIDPEVAETAFRLSLNEVSAPVTTSFGAALVRVSNIVPKSVKPFESVSAEIKKTLAIRAAERSVLETHDEIEDARAGGATLAEIATRFKLTSRTIEVDASGNGPDGAPVADIPEGKTLVDAAFASDEGAENDPLQSGRGFIWYDVAKVAPARERPLTEVNDKAVAAWTVEETDKRLTKKADDLAAALRNGGDFAALAAAAGAEVKSTEAFARTADLPALGAPGIDAAFGGPEGHVGTVEGADRSRIVLKVKAAVVPPFFAEAADAVEATQRFAGDLQNSLITQYIDELQTKLGTTVNQQILDSAIGLSNR